MRVVSAVLIAASMLVLSLFAQDDAKPNRAAKTQAKENRRADRQNDAQLAETNLRQTAIREWDTDRNLLVDDAELEAAMPRFLAQTRDLAAALVRRFDRNGDGRLDARERQDLEETRELLRRSSEVEEMDPNRDYTISSDEEQAVKNSIREQVSKWNQRTLSVFDTNFDGAVSAEERREGLERIRAGARNWRRQDDR